MSQEQAELLVKENSGPRKESKLMFNEDIAVIAQNCQPEPENNVRLSVQGEDKASLKKYKIEEHPRKSGLLKNAIDIDDEEETILTAGKKNEIALELEEPYVIKNAKNPNIVYLCGGSFTKGWVIKIDINTLEVKRKNEEFKSGLRTMELSMDQKWLFCGDERGNFFAIKTSNMLAMFTMTHAHASQIGAIVSAKSFTQRDNEILFTCSTL